MLAMKKGRRSVESTEVKQRTRTEVHARARVEVEEQVDVQATAAATDTLCNDDSKAYAHRRWEKKRGRRTMKDRRAYNTHSRNSHSRKTCGAVSWKEHWKQEELVVKAGAREGRTESCRTRRRRRRTLQQQRYEDAQNIDELLRTAQKNTCAEYTGKIAHWEIAKGSKLTSKQ